MATEEQMLGQTRRWMVAGLSPATISVSGKALWGAEESEIEALTAKVMKQLGHEAERMDILAEMALQYHCQGTVIDMMAREMKKEPQNAHFFNTLRNCLKDRLQTLLKMNELRGDESRNKYQTEQQKEAEEVKEKRLTDLHFSTTKSKEHMGYGYYPELGTVQPGMFLNEQAVTERDVVRVRMFPKSPREDAILDELLVGLNQEAEAIKYDWRHLSDEEVQTDIRLVNPDEFDPKKEVFKTPPTMQEQSLIARRIFIERLRAYNETWEQAEAKVTGIMQALGIRLGFRHESVGLPAVVRKAAEGDEESIQLLKEVVENYKKKQATQQGEVKQKKYAKYYADWFPKVAKTTLSLLLAFALTWVCLWQVVGPVWSEEVSSSGRSPDRVSEADRRSPAIAHPVARSGDRLQREHPVWVRECLVPLSLPGRGVRGEG